MCTCFYHTEQFLQPPCVCLPTVTGSACVASLEKELDMTTAFWIQNWVVLKANHNVVKSEAGCHLDRIWNFGIRLFPAVWSFSQWPDRLTESPRWHLCRSSCPAPLLRAMSGWVLSISKDRGFTTSLDMISSSIDDPHSEKIVGFLFCVLGYFLSYT